MTHTQSILARVEYFHENQWEMEPLHQCRSFRNCFIPFGSVRKHFHRSVVRFIPWPRHEPLPPPDSGSATPLAIVKCPVNGLVEQHSAQPTLPAKPTSILPFIATNANVC